MHALHIGLTCHYDKLDRLTIGLFQDRILRQNQANPNEASKKYQYGFE